jgi:succinyl-diaminopimelate desuccinylase
MKAGVAASITAFQLLSEIESQIQGKVSLQLVSDEETGGKWGTKWLLENEPSLRGTACIIGEPTGLQVSIGMKGKVYMLLTAQGRAGHGSVAQFAGENAIMKMAKAMPVIMSMARVRGRRR